MKHVTSHYLLAAVIIFLAACGGGGGSTTPTETNSSGFPEVAGRYSFNTSNFSVSCSDGSTGTNPPVALNIRVSQTENSLLLENLSIGPGVPGITIISANNAQGNIQKDSSFIINQIIIADINGIGRTTLNYSWTGNFSSSGWSGTYRYSSTFGLDSCTFISTFTGDRIGSKEEIQIAENNSSYDFPVDIYDRFGVLAKLAALLYD